MKKMKRFLVAMLGGLTAVACLAGVSACKKDEAKQPSYEININKPADVVVEAAKPCVHDYSVYYTKVEPTCENEGYQVLGCSKCGEVLNTGLSFGGADLGAMLPIPATGHKYYKVAAVPAGCATPGNIEHLACENCDMKFDADLVELATVETLPTGVHAFKAATCEAPMTCDCGETKGEALGHNMMYAFDVGVNVTTGDPINNWLTWGGLVSLKTEKAADGSVYVAKTCEEVGFKNFKICATCANAWYTEYVKADDNRIEWAGLSAQKRLQLVAENAYVEGYEEIAAGHEMVDLYGTAKDVAAGTALVEKAFDKLGQSIAADCDDKGLTNFKVCKVCTKVDAVKAADTFAKVELLVKGNATTKATVYAEGFDAAVVAELGHDYGDTYKAGVAATCTKDGYTEEYDCQRAGCIVAQTKTKIPALVHDGAASATATAVTAPFTNAASKKATLCGELNYCGDCGEFWGPEGGLDHTGKKSLTAKAATCTTDGYNSSSYYCEDCGYVKYVVSNNERAKGHKWSTTATTQVADCTRPALSAHYTCTNGCGALATKDDAGKYTLASIESLTTEAAKNHTFKFANDAEPRAYTGAELINQILADLNAHAAAAAANTCAGFVMSTAYKCTTCNAYQANIASLHNPATKGVLYIDALGYPVPQANAAVVNGEKATFVVGTTAATCTDAAKCNICNASIGTALGHEFKMNTATERNNYVAAVAPTCTTTGMQGYFICTKGCGAVAVAAGTTQATRKDVNGNDTLVTIYNYAEFLTINAMGHDMVDVAKEDSTCSKVGYEKHTACKACGYSEDRVEIPMKDHKNETYEGSCATTINCAVCGAEFANPNVQPDNHIWSAPNCPVNGECYGCGHVCAHTELDVNKVCKECGIVDPRN